MALTCKHCGETLQSLMFFAVMADLGARPSVDPLRCAHGEHAGQEHQFAEQVPATLDAPEMDGWHEWHQNRMVGG